ncbi:MAG: DNA-directed RNA polymerase subunit omega [Christensenellales bacterium]|jgi:DNA-directed RNA polymerase subunit omega
MIYPALYELLDKVDCRYTLVMEAAKRARQLVDGADPMVEVPTTKPVAVAVQEIYENKVHYERTRDGIK